MNASLKTRKNVVTFFTYLVLILGSISMIFPFVWMVLTSFKTQAESMAIPPQILPSHWNLDSFVKALQSLPFTNLYVNTGLLILFRVIFAVVFSSMAGYAFAKLKFKGSNVLFIIYLAQMMVPSQLTLIPRFVIFSQLGWMNTHMSLIVPKIIAVSSTFMLRQSFLGTPDELREAARIDGAGEYRAFAQVMLPLVKPTIAATATVQFLDAWNSYLDPLVFISNWKKWTIPLALNQFVGTEVTQYNLTMAACCMAVVPVFIVFLFGQKFFLKGLSVGAVKG